MGPAGIKHALSVRPPELHFLRKSFTVSTALTRRIVMKKRALFVIPALLILMNLVFFPSLLKADQVIKGNKHTDAFSMAGQSYPAKDEETTTWLGKDKMRRDEGETTTLIRLDENKMYVIDNTDKTYSEIDLPFDVEAALPPQAKQIMSDMEISSKVTDTGETQAINDWKCKKYLVDISVSMMGMSIPIKIIMWTSTDLDVDMDDYKKLYSEVLSLNPMFKDFAEEFEKIDGYPVLTEFSMDMMGAEQKYTEEVLSVEKKEAPAGTYNLPEGYTKTTFNPFEQRR
jgi:hypothetical protein